MVEAALDDSFQTFMKWAAKTAISVCAQMRIPTGRAGPRAILMRRALLCRAEHMFFDVDR